MGYKKVGQMNIYKKTPNWGWIIVIIIILIAMSKGKC